MFLLKLESKLQSSFKKFQIDLKILTKFRLNFHEVKYFYKMECRAGQYIFGVALKFA